MILLIFHVKEKENENEKKISLDSKTVFLQYCDDFRGYLKYLLGIFWTTPKLKVIKNQIKKFNEEFGGKMVAVGKAWSLHWPFNW